MRGMLKIIPVALATMLSGGYGAGLPLQADSAESAFVAKEMTTYEGIYLEVKGKPPDNYRKVGVALDTPVEIGANDFLSLTFRNLADANIPLSVTLQDEKGNLLHTGYTGSEKDYKTHYYIPENTADLQTVKEYYGCVNMKKEVRGGELLVDISETAQTGNTVTSIDKVFIGLPAAYNVGEKIELLQVRLADGAEFSYAEGEGFSLPEREIVDSLVRTDVYDFTTIESQAQFETLCKEYKILKCNQENAVTKTFENYVAIGKAEVARGVTLAGDVRKGVRFALKENGTYISAEETDDHYAADKFGYIRLADLSGKPVRARDALALKMSALYKNSAFRIIVVEEDGEVWQAGAASGRFVFATDTGGVEYMPTYYNCIWPDKREGTLTVPYSAMKRLSSGGAAFPYAENDKALTSVKEIYLAMDMAKSSKDAKFRKLAFAAIADVDFAAETLSVVADLTNYTVSEAREKKADVNFAAAEKSLITKPSSTNETANSNWILGRPALWETASKAALSEQYMGDVKILDNFRIEDMGYTQEEKDEIIGGFYSSYGEASYVSYNVLGDHTPALAWKIGNYANEYQNVSGGYCGLTIDPVSDADDWANWQGAKGMTLRLKNPQSKEVSFNIAFQQTWEGETIAYRMNYSDAAVYALDTLTGEEFSFRTGAVSAFSSGPAIYLPAHFDGWIRLDFSSFGKYSAAGPDEIDFSNDVIALKITSYMLDNSDAKILLGAIGVYYDAFTVGWSFDGTGKTIADCLEGGKRA